MAELLFHPETRDEYVGAVEWYHERSRRAAAKFEKEVGRVLEDIVAHPERYPEYDDAHRFAVLRRFPYSVIYQSVPHTV